MRKLTITLAAVATLAATALVSPVRASITLTPTATEYRLAPSTLDTLGSRWLARVVATHPAHTWAPLKVDLDDADLALMDLPTKAELQSHRYSKPTKASRSRGVQQATGVTFAGAGWLGIRPGAWLLIIDDQGVGWCSAAHVYGSPGAYSISTAGHCGKPGTVITMLGAVQEGDTITPLLVDIGTISTSHVSPNDTQLGQDWALISVYPALQSMVVPTMAFWGGPVGMFTARGDLDPTQIVHYGHGTAIGTAGTPRTATALTWGDDQFTFVGAITPGDSGSGANVVLDPTTGGVMEAGGIITHLWVDPSFEEGYGIMGGTRATVVSGALANGALVATPLS